MYEFGSGGSETAGKTKKYLGGGGEERYERLEFK
jgi:hypothetical protein